MDSQEALSNPTRDRVIKKAIQVASVEGLEGLSIGRLAAATDMSKGGLFAVFGSKKALQLAVVERAREVFVKQVVETSRKVEEGFPRLVAMQTDWIRHIERSPFRGGCFFAAASSEFDGRPGAVRSKLAALTGHWRRLLEEEARRAITLGHLDPTADAALIAFQLHGFVQEANWAFQLLEDSAAFDHARAASHDLLRRYATSKGARSTKKRRVVPARKT